MNINITSFNSGEMSPLLQARSDTAKHASGCKRLENFIPRVSGALVRRPGMEYLTTCRDETRKVIAVGMNFGVGDSVVLEMGHQYFRVLLSDGSVQAMATTFSYWDPVTATDETISGLPTTHRVTPWSAEHLHELQFCQINNLIYVVHADYPPHRIARSGVNHWYIEAVQWDWPAMADENITTATMTYGIRPRPGFDELECSKVYFTSDDVGSYIELKSARESMSVEVVIDEETLNTEAKSCTFIDLASASYLQYLGLLRVVIPAHSWPIGAKLKITSESTLPPGIEGGKTYYISSEGYNSGFFFISETEGGSLMRPARHVCTAATGDDYVTAEGNDFVDGQSVVFSSTGTLPAPLVAGTTYYVREFSNGAFRVSATAGGARINITTVGTGSHTVNRLSSGTHTVTRQLPYPLETPAPVTRQTDLLSVLGKAKIFTFGAWQGSVKLKKFTAFAGGILSLEGETLQTWVSNGDRNLAIEIEQYPEAQLFLEVEGSKVAPQVETETWGRDARFVLEASEATVSQLVKIEQYVTDTVVKVTTISGQSSLDPTTQWAESAWSKKRGYPRAVCLHQQRLFFAGTATDQQTIWASAIGDFQNFRRSSLDDASISLSIATTQRNLIQWLTASAGGVVIGTSGDEWTLTAESGVVTATNFQAKRQSSYGSKYLQPLGVNEVILFMQRGGRKLREHVFSFERDGYIAPDLTLLADHITRGGIRSMCMMQQPDTIVWFARNDGMLLGMTYEREQQVVAWHRHPTQGEVESVTTIYGEDGDDLLLVVKRGDRRFVERMNMATLRRNEAQSTNFLMNYLDSSVSYQFEFLTSQINNFHLVRSTLGCTVEGFPQEATNATQVSEITNSEVLTGDYNFALCNTLVIGLAYTSLVHINSFEVPMSDGASKSRKWRANRAALYYWQSSDAEISSNAADSVLRWDLVHGLYNGPGISSGVIEIALNSRFDEAPEIAVRVEKPIPLNVLGLVVKGDFYGD
jgi:hypothetical protein